MLLSAKILADVASVNNFRYIDAYTATEGDIGTLTVQIVDLSQDPSSQGFDPPGRRYMPAAGATMTISLVNIDSAKGIVARAATQPYAQDPSIWQISILATDKVRGTLAMKLVLTESSKVTYGKIPAAANIFPLNGI